MHQKLVSYGGFSLVKVGRDTHIWDEADGSLSSPLHHSIVEAIQQHPESLLDVQMVGPTTRKSGVEEVEFSVGPDVDN